jgi:hypothetical protein
MTHPDRPRDSAPVELSEAELDEVAGGIDVVITGVLFEHEFSMQQTQNNSLSSTSFFSRTSATVFQFVGTGFDSMKDVFSMLSSFSRLFGR